MLTINDMKKLIVVIGLLCSCLAYGAQNSRVIGNESIASMEQAQQNVKTRKQMLLEAANSVYSSLSDKNEQRLMKRLIRGIKSGRIDKIMRHYTISEAETTLSLLNQTLDKLTEMYPDALTPEEKEGQRARFGKFANAAVTSDGSAVH